MAINEMQEKAIHHKDGPMIVLAGPGSGKTFVITRRLKEMTTSMGIDPSEILVITFTKAAAEEMESRFHSLMEDAFLPVTFGTFHSIFFSIIRQALNYTVKDIITESEKRALLKLVLSEFGANQGNKGLGYETIEEYPYLNEILSDISKVKNDGTDSRLHNPPYLCEGEFHQIYECYEEQCKLRKKVDFDDMVLLCHRLFKEHSDILSYWQGRYRYILVDEFQDINPMQYEVVRMLAHPENNLFIVGDDDQSIYGFRGSKPDIMLHFTDDYKDAVTVCLPKNYRSKASIVESAVSLIEHNQTRYHKTLTANEEGAFCVYEKGFDTKEAECEEILKLIHAYEQKGALKDIAFLVRTNTGAKYLIQKLVEHNIPYYFKEKCENLWESSEVKDILAVLAYANGEFYRSHLIRFVNKPVRYVKRSYLESPVIMIRDLLSHPEVPPYCKRNLSLLLSDLQRIKGMDPYSAISYIRKCMGIESCILESSPKDEDCIIENLNLMQEASRDFSDFRSFQRKIKEYETQMNTGMNVVPSTDHVTLQTMHGSKGLEYPVVILPDCNEGNVPQGKNPSKETIEEERRVFYVAMTRAKNYLFLFYIKKTKDNRKEISRFLKETAGLTAL